jgi:RNA-directed DNA polymerase
MNSAQLLRFFETLELGQSFINSLSGSRDELYETRQRRKRNGELRVLRLPNKDLKWVQTRVLRDVLTKQFTFPNYVQGGIRGRSTRTHAELHVGCAVVVNIDLRNFFENITYEQIKNALNRLHLEEDLRDIITRIATLQDSLPQGAPTSPFLANLAALDLDEKLFKIGQRSGANYSRYIDDITFSGAFDVDALLKEVHDYINSSVFTINESKTRIQREHRRQTVTKVIVNKKTSVPRHLIKQLRHDLYYCSKFGIYGHCEQTLEDNQQDFVYQLAARIGYVMSIDPRIGAVFKNQFRKLKDEMPDEKYVKEREARKLAQEQKNASVSVKISGLSTSFPLP